MKNSIKSLAFILILTVSASSLFGQAHQDESLYAAYLTTSKTFWKKGVQKMKDKYKYNPSTENLMNLALAEHGLLSMTMKDQDEDLFDEYVDDTVDHLEELMESNEQWGEPRALLSSVYGFKIAYSSWKGMFLGGKSSSLMEKAKSLDPYSPIVWKLYADSKLFTPETWGGDKNEAMKAYEKAKELVESQYSDLKSNWLYLDIMVWLGQSYQMNDEIDNAITTYKTALEVEPDFHWVSKQLLPKAQKSKS